MKVVATDRGLKSCYFVDGEFGHHKMMYRDIIAALEDALAVTIAATWNLNASYAAGFPVPSAQPARSSVMLPRIEMPRFNGKYYR